MYPEEAIELLEEIKLNLLKGDIDTAIVLLEDLIMDYQYIAIQNHDRRN